MARKQEAPPADIISDLVADMQRQFGVEEITTLGADNVTCKVSEWCSTGNKLLDYAIGGAHGRGLPAGRIVELFGETSHGKSTLAATCLGQMQKKGGISVLFDTENGFSPTQAAVVGIDLAKLVCLTAGHIQEVFERMEALIEKYKARCPDKPMLIVWDSLAATPTKQEIEGEFGQQFMGVQARVMSQALRKISSTISKHRIFLLILNQMRQGIGGYGDTTYTPGGLALPFYSSVRMKIKRRGYIRRAEGKDEITEGISCEVQCVKNKVSVPFRSALFPMMFKSGIDDVGSWWQFLIKYGAIHQSGPWHKMDYQGQEISLRYQTYLEKCREDKEFELYCSELVDKTLLESTSS